MYWTTLQSTACFIPSSEMKAGVYSTSICLFLHVEAEGVGGCPPSTYNEGTTQGHKRALTP